MKFETKIIHIRWFRKKSKIIENVMLNLIQHLTKSTTYETLKQVQGDRLGLFTSPLYKVFEIWSFEFWYCFEFRYSNF